MKRDTPSHIYQVQLGGKSDILQNLLLLIVIWVV